MVAIFRILFLLVVVYLLLLLPRLGHPGWEKLAGVRYAHRGLHNKDKGIPENSMTALSPPMGEIKESCFSAVILVRGWNQCV